MMTDEEYYEHCYKYRPEEKDLEKVTYHNYTIIKIRTQFPKTIEKDTYIISDFHAVSYDAMKEFYILKHILQKPLIACATSGRWEGTPFSLRAEDDIVITLEDEKIIQHYLKKNISSICEDIKAYHEEIIYFLLDWIEEEHMGASIKAKEDIKEKWGIEL